MAGKTIPILPSSDFDRTASFYATLGFGETVRYPDEYLIVERADGIELHFWFNSAFDPFSNDAGCYVRFGSADEATALHDEWAAAGVDATHLRPIEDTGYNLAEFALVDHDRNLIRVGGVITTP